MTKKPTAAERVAQALEILADVFHNPNSSPALLEETEQTRFDLLEAFDSFQADRTRESAENLRGVLTRVIAVYDRSIRIQDPDPLAGLRPKKTLLSR